MSLLAKTLDLQLRNGTLPPISEEDEKMLGEAVESLWQIIEWAQGLRDKPDKNAGSKSESACSKHFFVEYVEGTAPRTEMVEEVIKTYPTRGQYVVMRAHARALELELREG